MQVEIQVVWAGISSVTSPFTVAKPPGSLWGEAWVGDTLTMTCPEVSAEPLVRTIPEVYLYLTITQNGKRQRLAFSRITPCLSPPCGAAPDFSKVEFVAMPSVGLPSTTSSALSSTGSSPEPRVAGLFLCAVEAREVAGAEPPVPWLSAIKVPKREVVIRVSLYQAEHLAPADDDGGCDAYVELSWRGSTPKISSVNHRDRG